jgi:hypothetical protein
MGRDMHQRPTPLVFEEEPKLKKKEINQIPKIKLAFFKHGVTYRL